LFDHLQKLSLSFFSHYSVGRIIVRVINDVGVLREFITWAVLAIARDFFTLIGILIAMISMDIRLSLITYLTIPLMVGATLVQKVAPVKLPQVRGHQLRTLLAENINGVRVVQAFSRQERQLHPLLH
jgi:ABC-type multidrug transport system fused ATPase/permease subunit